MTINFYDKCYGEHKYFSMEDLQMGQDLTILFAYLKSHQRDLQQKLVWDNLPIGKRVLTEAKITKIDFLFKKYSKLIEFVSLVAEEETAL